MPPEGLEVARIGDLAGLETLRPEWLELWRRVPDATPFQSPAWLIPWWRVFGQGELLAFTVRRGGRLVGLVPLYVLAENGTRKLLPVGIGISDYLDPLIDAETSARAMAAVVRELERASDRFDRVDLEQQREGSAWLTAAFPERWSRHAHDSTPAPVLTLPDTGLSGHRRNRLRYYRRRAEAIGGASVRVANGAELQRCLDELSRLHAARWQDRGEPGVLADPRVRRFHALAAPELLAQGSLRLYLLEVAERTAAVFHTMADRARCYVYLCGFDPELAQLSPGNLVIGQVIGEAAEAGIRHIHFLRGQEGYKYSWGAVDQPMTALRLIPG